MQENPTQTVSVVVPAYNAEHTLHAALRSVLRQSCPVLETIVVDDGSTDATVAVAQRYASAVRVVRQANAGVSAARNHGARLARGELLAFLDADDVWYQDKLTLQTQAMRDLSLGGVVCAFEPIDTRGASLDPPITLGGLGGRFGLAAAVQLIASPGGRSGVAAGSCLVVRRALFQALGGFDESLATAEDTDLLVRLAAASPLGAVDRPLFGYRVSGVSLSATVFSGSRLRVLEKVRGSGSGRQLEPGTLRRIQARVHRSYGRDLLWCGRVREARGQLIAAVRCEPEWESVCLLLKSLVPQRGIALLRRLARAGESVMDLAPPAMPPCP